MYILLSVVGGVLFVVFTVGIAIILRRLREVKELSLASQSDRVISQLGESVRGVQKSVEHQMRGIQGTMSGTTKTMNERLDNAAEVIGALNNELGGIKEIGRSISDFQAFLKSPKIRGNLGEQILYDALDQVFSNKQYDRQFKFKDGRIVDAILKTSAGIVPIDSKFPMEAYKRYVEADNERDELTAKKEFMKAVRKHIRDISSKYILPQEGTVNFAVMYVPTEAVYYEVTIQNDELNSYAQSSNVMVTSPNTFYNFLHIVMMGMERGHLQEQTQRIWEILKGVQKETEKFGEKMSVLSGHITHAKNSMDSVNSEYARLAGKVDRVNLLK